MNELRAAQQRVAELTRSALARRSGNEAAGPGRVDIARAANQRIWDFVHQPANVSLRAGTGYYSTPFRGRLFGEVKAAEVAKQLTTRGVDVLWLGANPCVPSSLDNIINAPADSGDYILENGRAITDTVEVWWLSGTLAPGTERAARTWRW